uniref:Uncharacterized protein n=1 Tax=Avena sativa TaxID=4498 RepID=A0ACD6A6M3_AVESA
MPDDGSDGSAGANLEADPTDPPVGDATELVNCGLEEYDPQFSSRISVKHVVDVTARFSDYKKWLVNEIGFGGMLKLPMVQKLNLKFSAAVMAMVDADSHAICIPINKVLKFWAEDVHKVFGIPCGNRDVNGRDGNISQDSINFMKSSLGMDKAGAHGLRAAKEFLNRDINEESSKLETDCFQIVFVIFVMGHLLAPSTKYDYCQIDFWGALANTENIAQFNWCDYVLQAALDGVAKLKLDMSSKRRSINLVGCHLFLQVFLLDNLDLALFNMKHDVLPRASAFDQVVLRRMITMAADKGRTPTSCSIPSPLRHAINVCYSRSKFVGIENIELDRPIGGWHTEPSAHTTTTRRPGLQSTFCDAVQFQPPPYLPGR